MAKTVLLAGLGNPGRKYAQNRHNAGFLLLDYMENRLQASSREKKKGCESAKAVFKEEGGNAEIILIWPQDFMNLSGGAVCELMRFYKVPAHRLIVLHDEIELSFGDVRIKKGGGHKGHNGLRDIMDRCSTPDFVRLRFGVGRPEKGDVAGYVLSDFSPEEKEKFPEIFFAAEKLLISAIQESLIKE